MKLFIFLFIVAGLLQFSCKNEFQIGDVKQTIDKSLGTSVSYNFPGDEIFRKETLDDKLKSYSQTIDYETLLTDNPKYIKQRINQLKIGETQAKVDLVISVDTSGSMSTEIVALKTNLQKFIEIVAGCQDVSGSLVCDSQKSIDLHLRFTHATGNSSKTPGTHYVSRCFVFPGTNINTEMTAAKNYITSLSTSEDGESPIYWAIQTFKEDQAGGTNPSDYTLDMLDTAQCFRDDAYKYLFAMTDEDEHEPWDSSSGTEPLNNRDPAEYIDYLHNNSISLYTVVHDTASYILLSIIPTMQAAQLVNVQRYTFPGSDSELATQLENFGRDIIETVAGYAIDTDPVEPESLTVFIEGNPITQGTDYTVTSDHTMIQINDTLLRTLNKDDDLTIKYLKPDDFTVRVSTVNGDGRDLGHVFKTRINVCSTLIDPPGSGAGSGTCPGSGSGSSVTLQDCAVITSPSGENVDELNLWNCIKNTNMSAENKLGFWSLAVHFLRDKLYLPIGNNPPAEKSDINFTRNSIPETTYNIIEENGEKLIQLNHSSISYEVGDTIRAAYVDENALSCDLYEGTFNQTDSCVELTTPIGIKTVQYGTIFRGSFQGNEVSCYRTERTTLKGSQTSKDILVLEDCEGQIAAKQSRVVYVAYYSATEDDFIFDLPENAIGEDMKVEGLVGIEALDISDKIRFAVNLDLLGKGFNVTYIKEDELTIHLDVKPSENLDEFVVLWNDYRMKTDEYTLKLTKPYAVILQNKERFRYGDIIHISYY
ncbi:hypothetical protein JW979_07200 [bacterium]|nr:hypothetical protein [candidate division CSSED10-310 bacterium]